MDWIGSAYDLARWSVDPRHATAWVAIQTIATVLAFVAAGIYVVLTYRLWRESHRTNQTALMQQLMAEYDRLQRSISTVQNYYLGFPSKEQALEAFRQAQAADDQNNDIMRRVDPSRFRVSRFFVKIRKLANAGFLERQIIVAALSRAAIRDVFLDQIDPLDQVICRLTYGKENLADRDFFTDLLREPTMPNEGSYTDQDVHRAWLYHANADHIQHQRYIVFVLIETILFAAFGQVEGMSVLAWIIAFFGILVAWLWGFVAGALEKRLDAMRAILRAADRVWRGYEDAISLHYLLGGRWVFNRWLPGLTVGLWIALLFARATTRS